jgi:hypothetical protein
MAIVVSPFVFMIWRRMAPTPETVLLEAFPVDRLRQQPDDRFIVDPLLRPESAAGGEYGKHLDVLLDAHRALGKEEAALADATDHATVAKVRQMAAEFRLRTTRNQWRLFRNDAREREVATEARVYAQRTVDVENADRQVLAAETAVARVRDAAREADRSAGLARPTEAGEDAIRIERDTVLVMFRKEANVEDIRRVLRRYHLDVRSTMPAISLFVTETEDKGSSDEGAAARLHAILDRLRNEPNVEVAVPNTLLGVTTVPPPASTRWFDSSNPDPLVTSGFPYAWNFNDAILRRNRPVKVGILDLGFVSNADVPFRSVCKSPVSDHGTQMAAIIGAQPGHPKGQQFAARLVELYGECVPLNPATVPSQKSEKEWKTSFDELLAAFERLLKTPVRVVNASIGYNWHTLGIVPDDLTNAQSGFVRTMVAGHGAAVRSLLELYPDAMLVSAAGNDNGLSAMWASPFNWAALETSDPSENALVVEGLDQTGTANIPASNVGGSIRAVGVNVQSLPDPCRYGTSCAAPLVTAAIAQMLAINDKLTPAEIRKNLGIKSGTAASLDAFAAAMASSPDFAADLADYDGNGVAMSDFRRFKKHYKAFVAGVKNGGAFAIDLNGDGKSPDANEARFCRSDFNGDNKIDKDDLKIMMKAWTDPNVDPKTLPAELEK